MGTISKVSINVTSRYKEKFLNKIFTAQNARTWRGNLSISPVATDGYQYVRVAGAVAADDPWLVTGDDKRRFRFEVITSGTESLNLQASGLIGWTTGIEGERYGGWALLLGHQFFSVGWDEQHGTMMFAIFNGVARQRAEMLDGLSVATLRDAGSSPACSACVMERVGDLSGDPAADDEYFADEVEALNPLVPPEEVPENIREHLARSVTDDAPGLMRMFFASSMARGPLLEA